MARHVFAVRFRAGISNSIFVVSVIVLLIVAVIGFALYLSKPAGESMTQTTTENMTETTTEIMSQTTAEQMTSTAATTSQSVGSTAVSFNASAGQMIHTAWLVVAPTGGGHYALSVHAEGLDTTQATDNVYIVEGVQSSGSMESVPIGPNETASEFSVTSNGVGNFFILLNQNPFSTYDDIQIVLLPGMQMTNATVVATASLSMMS